MAGPLPDAGRFRRAMDGVLGSHARFGDGARERRPVLAFGEMTDLLARQGNLEGSIRLEELWNELAETYTFSLLCAYSLGAFSEDTHDAALRAICNQHAHVLPTERYMRVDDGARLREIALLQQRALALETELLRRRELEGELRDALRAAHAASRAKSDFLTAMSHELRTPLNAIGGHAQLLEMGLHGALTDAQREALERIQRSQRHLLAMINDLLNLAEVDAGRVRYAIEHLPIAPVIQGMATLLAPLAGTNGIAIAVRPPAAGDEALHVQADPGEAAADSAQRGQQRHQVLDARRTDHDRGGPLPDRCVARGDPRARYRRGDTDVAARVDLRAVRSARRSGARATGRTSGWGCRSAGCSRAGWAES